MSVIVMLALPLIATALVCIPAKRSWATGITIASCLAIFALALRVAWLQVDAGALCVCIGSPKRPWRCLATTFTRSNMPSERTLA